FLEAQALAFGYHPNRIAGPEVAAQDALRERVLELLLDRALRGPSAVDRIIAGFGETGAPGRGEQAPHAPPGEPAAQIVEVDVDDLADVLGLERTEHDDVVDAVHELRAEVLTDDLHDLGLHARVVLRAHELLDALAAQVRRHDDDGVTKVDRAA